MNILYLVPYAPTMIRTRPYNLIRGLSQRGHHITMAACWENQEERQTLKEWNEIGVRVLAFPLSRVQMGVNLTRAFFSKIPLQARYSWQPRLARSVIDLLHSHRVDVIHIEHLRGALYGLRVKKRGNDSLSKIPVVWDSVDCISSLFEQAVRMGEGGFGRWVRRFEISRTKHFERQLIRRFERTLVTSEDDQYAMESLDQYGSTGHVRVLTNGVDLEYFSPDRVTQKKEIILFSGKLSYHANVTAALYLVREIMPLVWKSRPEVAVVLAGKDPAPVIKVLPEFDRRVIVTGTVEDLRPYLREASIAVAPILYGAGIQNKVLEAMACGTAVVASPKAISALSDLRPGKDILVAENASGFADGILKLLVSRELSDFVSQNGNEYVRRAYDWKNVVNNLEGIYTELLA